MAKSSVPPSEGDEHSRAERIVVLLIEDNPADVRLIREQLAEVSQTHFELRVAGSLAAGLAEIARAKPDIVLLDLSLPDSQALDTLAHVRACQPDLPSVVMTGLDDETLSMEAVKAGAQDYLVKGGQNGRQLTRALRNSIQRQRLQTEIRSSAMSASMEDDLTGLCNRGSFMALARQAMKVAHRTRTALIILSVDLSMNLSMDVDAPKPRNDGSRRASGDQDLLETANLLRATFRESDIMARLGGDEFAVLAPVRPDPDNDTDALLSRLQDNLNALNARPNRPIRLSLHVGIGRYDPARPCSVEELLAQAERSRYEERARQRTP
jgi:two-component system cell cycle response regulator